MRGEGNHKIPGSFAPENMEKTGAERVKYSLACQHEDAISIKFVSYAQKCPTVLCTFAVALRKESVDRNTLLGTPDTWTEPSLSARRAWIEITRTTLTTCGARSLSARRAWIEIRAYGVYSSASYLSLSARRAWIEIHFAWRPATRLYVALRKESVDRNNRTDNSTGKQLIVALRKESVDRNTFISYTIYDERRCRSPQGERG